MDQLLAQLPPSVVALLDKWDSNVLLITIASFLAWLVWKVIYNRLEILTQKTRFHWDDLILASVSAPISALIWCWPATISLGFILEDYTQSKLDWLSTLKLMLVIGIFVWITMRLVTNIEDYALTQKNRDETTVQAVAKVARLFFIVIGALTIMQSFGLSLSGLLTFGGVGSL